MTREELEAAKAIGAGLVAGMLRPVGAGVWNLTPGPARISNVGAISRLAQERISKPINFDAGVVYIPGDPQNNAGLVRTPQNIEAFLRQTPEEHAEALDRYLSIPDIPPERAARLGERAEEQLVRWWNDSDPRVPVTPTSSAVKSARIGPNGDIYIVFGSNPNKEYQYEGSQDPVEASRILQQLVTAPSIGRSVNSWTGDWGTRHTYLPKG